MKNQIKTIVTGYEFKGEVHYRIDATDGETMLFFVAEAMTEKDIPNARRRAKYAFNRIMQIAKEMFGKNDTWEDMIRKIQLDYTYKSFDRNPEKWNLC